MSQQFIDTTTNHGTYTGDPLPTAFSKINANDTELYTLANGSLKKSGDTMSGLLSANVGVRVVSGSGASMQGSYLGWNGISPGSGGADFQNNVGGGNGGFFFATVNNAATAVLGTFSFSPTGGWGNNTSSRFAPTVDANQTLGGSGLRWTAIYSVNGSIQTSDANAKMSIEDSKLGLDFILSLRPVSYKMKVARNEVTDTQNPNPTYETIITGHDISEDGTITPITKQVSYDLTIQTVTPVPGTRIHEGLLAQEVAAALTTAGADPSLCGMWTRDDPADASSAQGLRYDELIGPIIKAMQEQQAMIVALTARIATLEGGQAASA